MVLFSLLPQQPIDDVPRSKQGELTQIIAYVSHPAEYMQEDLSDDRPHPIARHCCEIAQPICHLE